MRFLYGDSTAFPLQYDFLAALRVFIDQASLASRLDADARLGVDAAERDAVTRSQAADALESVHLAVMRSMTTATLAATQPLIVDYVQKITDFSTRLVADAKRDALTSADRLRADARSRIDSSRAQARTAIETLLLGLRLPTSESAIGMDLMEGTNELSSVLVHSDGIVTSYGLSTSMFMEWQKPRKVSDFATGVSLPVGIKRSIFKRSVQHEPMVLDDLFLSGFEIGEESAELRFRKKPDQKDVLSLALHRKDDGSYYAEVEHPGESGIEALQTTLDASATTEIERLATLLRSAVGPVLTHKARVTSVSISGRDVFDGGDGIATLLSTLVRMLSPTVAEISRRSPSPNELSLKTEDDAGKRQEIYVKKADLREKLATVPPTEKHAFDPLSLSLEARFETPSPPSAK